MKYMFASDIHGSAYYCKKTLEVFEASGAQASDLTGRSSVSWTEK